MAAITIIIIPGIVELEGQVIPVFLIRRDDRFDGKRSLPRPLCTLEHHSILTPSQLPAWNGMETHTLTHHRTNSSHQKMNKELRVCVNPPLLSQRALCRVSFRGGGGGGAKGGICPSLGPECPPPLNFDFYLPHRLVVDAAPPTP